MKLILTGATGYIGSEVLAQCLKSPLITSIFVLSRPKLPDLVAKYAKLEVIIIEDFMNYPESVMTQLSGADACIWYE